MDPIKDIIQSHFFTDIIIYNYSRQITSILDDKIIMNMDELIKYLLKPIKNTSTEFYIENKHRMFEYFKENIHNFSICSAIEEAYLKSTLKIAFNPIENFTYNENFDISFIFKSPIIDDKEFDESITKEELEVLYESKLSKLIGFIIVERNECKKLGNAYALNLVCSKEGSIGSILVGLYLFSIFSHPLKIRTDILVKKIEIPDELNIITIPTFTGEEKQIYEYYGPQILHIGLLELSGGYNNISALCLYSKFGFIEDKLLSGSMSNCFRSNENIAMRTNYTDEPPESVKETILKIVLKREPVFEKHVICNFKDNKLQGFLAHLYMLEKKEAINLNSLESQANFSVNKLEDGSLNPDFEEKLNSVKTKLEKIPKVKGKTSEKIIFEVKQNLKKFEGFLDDSSSSSPKSANESLSILALLQLGFDEKTANREVKKQLEKTPDAETADIIREVLKYS
jgi:hypothetical protein